MMQKIFLVRVPWRRWQILLEVFNVFLLVSFFVILAALWTKLPQLIPFHFNITGEVDAWSGRNSALFLPFLSVVIYGLFLLASFFPRLCNIPIKITDENTFWISQNAAYMMSFLRTFVLLFLGYLQLATLTVLSLSPWITFGLLVLLLSPIIWFTWRSAHFKK